MLPNDLRSQQNKGDVGHEPVLTVFPTLTLFPVQFQNNHHRFRNPARPKAEPEIFGDFEALRGQNLFFLAPNEPSGGTLASVKWSGILDYSSADLVPV